MTNFEKVTKNERALAEFVFKREYDVFEGLCKRFGKSPEQFFTNEDKVNRIKEIKTWLREGSY